MQKKIILVFILVFLGAVWYTKKPEQKVPSQLVSESQTEDSNQDGPGPAQSHPLSIAALRNGEYPGSDFVIEQTLVPGSNYERYIASYKSEGLKIYGLLTIPSGTKPETGWPVIIFNHGYIPPREYKTTERYVAYTDAFSRNGYVLFRPDYRGHGNSEGEAAGGYGSNAYTIDVLNAVASIKKLRNPAPNSENNKVITDVNRIGMWGHSMGGHVTLRNMVINKDVKVGIIWAGVVGSYPDLVNNWRRRSPAPTALPGNMVNSSRNWRQNLITQYGEPEDNPDFWNSLSANSYLADISGPLELHHGTADHSVPLEFSEKLAEQLKSAGKVVELYTYLGDDHNIATNFGTAITRSVDFFDRVLKRI